MFPNKIVIIDSYPSGGSFEQKEQKAKATFKAFYLAFSNDIELDNTSKSFI